MLRSTDLYLMKSENGTLEYVSGFAWEIKLSGKFKSRFVRESKVPSLCITPQPPPHTHPHPFKSYPLLVESM